MIKITNAQLWVHDQDEALAFYTEKVGMEVRADVTMEAWNFRWLCVGPPGQDGIGLVLMPVPAAPTPSPITNPTAVSISAWRITRLTTRPR